MKLNKNTVIATLAVVAAYNEVACYINGRRLTKANARLEDSKNYNALLVKRLNDEGIRPTEFEVIIMDELTSKK